MEMWDQKATGCGVGMCMDIVSSRTTRKRWELFKGSSVSDSTVGSSCRERERALLTT